jgi:hypothetical protein
VLGSGAGQADVAEQEAWNAGETGETIFGILLLGKFLNVFDEHL